MAGHSGLRFGLLLGALLFIGSCGQNNPAETNAANAPAAAGGEMVFHRGNGAEPDTLDPTQSIAHWEDAIISDMLIGLTTQDADGKTIPGAAESWETSADGLTWTFHLRDHQWSDGTPVTAEDFLYAWRRILDPKQAARYAYFLYVFKNAEPINTGKMPGTALGARAIDDKTIELTLEHPAPYLPEMLYHITTLPLPRHVVEAKGNAWTQPGTYVGNGPYTLSERVPNDHITLVKNPRFYDAANVKVDRVVFYPTQDYDAGLRRFRAGELDVQDRLPAAQIDWIKQNMADSIHLGPQLTLEFYAMNQSRPPFNDVRVREAFSLALDRENITDVIRRVGEVPAYNYVPPGIANFPHSNTLAFKTLTPAERIARAQELMRAAGYGPEKRLKTVLSIRSTSADGRRVPAAVQQMWKAIYVDAEIEPNDTPIFYNKVEEHDFDIALAAWGADFNDASNFLDLLRTGVGNNYGLYSNREFDRLLDQAGLELDLTKRAEILSQAEAMAMKDHAWIPELFWVTTNLVHPYVKGYPSNPTDNHRTRWVTVEPH